MLTCWIDRAPPLSSPKPDVEVIGREGSIVTANAVAGASPGAQAGVRNGTVTVRESYDFKVALSTKLSDKIGAQGNLNRKHNYQVECEFA